LLLLSANQVVPTDSLIQELWGGRPPLTATTTAQTYIYQLRKKFAACGLGPADGVELLTRPPGYVLTLRQDQLDLEVFERLVGQGRTLLDADHPEAAAAKLRQALGLWNGRPLANVNCGPVLEAHAAELVERRARVLALRIEADLRLGRHREIIGELRLLVAQDSLNEWLHCQLVRALAGAGRRADALQAYQSARTVLSEQLGLEPSMELRLVQQEVLAASSYPPASPKASSAAPIARAASHLASVAPAAS
jgi:DNA-binding SARP family transcriptional activator